MPELFAAVHAAALEHQPSASSQEVFALRAALRVRRHAIAAGNLSAPATPLSNAFTDKFREVNEDINSLVLVEAATNTDITGKETIFGRAFAVDQPSPGPIYRSTPISAEAESSPVVTAANEASSESSLEAKSPVEVQMARIASRASRRLMPMPPRSAAGANVGARVIGTPPSTFHPPDLPIKVAAVGSESLAPAGVLAPVERLHSEVNSLHYLQITQNCPRVLGRRYAHNGCAHLIHYSTPTPSPLGRYPFAFSMHTDKDI
jgi:hypothetical protein